MAPWRRILDRGDCTRQVCGKDCSLFPWMEGWQSWQLLVIVFFFQRAILALGNARNYPSLALFLSQWGRQGATLPYSSVLSSPRLSPKTQINLKSHWNSWCRHFARAPNHKTLSNAMSTSQMCAQRFFCSCVSHKGRWEVHWWRPSFVTRHFWLLLSDCTVELFLRKNWVTA